jgi:hypothetical protein
MRMQIVRVAHIFAALCGERLTFLERPPAEHNLPHRQRVGNIVQGVAIEQQPA